MEITFNGRRLRVVFTHHVWNLHPRLLREREGTGISLWEPGEQDAPVVVFKGFASVFHAPFAHVLNIKMPGWHPIVLGQTFVCPKDAYRLDTGRRVALRYALRALGLGREERKAAFAAYEEEARRQTIHAATGA